MAIRTNKAMGFADAVLDGGPKSSALLARLSATTPWDDIAAPIRQLPAYANAGAGRPSWDPAMMIRCLMLAKWFNLSDPGLEEALQDRISFRRFVGLSFDDATPDETSFVVLRQRLRDANLHDHIFRTVLEHIEAQGLLIREGTMVDATIIEAPRGRARPDGTSTRDAEADFTKKHGQSYHGYKAHIAVDLSTIVTDYRITTARVHDSQCIDALTVDETHAVIADSAYSDRARRAALRERGVIDAIMYKRVRGQPALHDWQERWNRIVSTLRARVEHPFGMLKQQLGYRRVRYRGRKRNEFDLALTLTACNLKRALSLQ